MHPNIRKWLDHVQPNGRKNIEKIAELVYRNGGSFRVNGWGYHHGPFGLDQDQAMELIHVDAAIGGMMIILGGKESPEAVAESKEIWQAIRDEWIRQGIDPETGQRRDELVDVDHAQPAGEPQSSPDGDPQQ